ncbi:MAG: hypothetical protein ABR969_04835 [Sedimentisphaerales bacterium]|jgi:hypothetical protein
MSYVPPKFTDKDGKVYEGEIAWQKAWEKFLEYGRYTIPEKPFADKPIKITDNNYSPGEGYRELLTEEERKVLMKAVPELSDAGLEAVLRRVYNMGDERIKKLTWVDVFGFLEDYLRVGQNSSKAGTEDLTDTKQNSIVKTLKKLFKNACELTLDSQFVCGYIGINDKTGKSRNEIIAENKIYLDLKNECQNLAGIEDLLKIWPIRDKAIGFLETYGKSALEVAYKFIQEAIGKRIPFLPNYPNGIHNFNCQEEELLAEIDIEMEKFKGQEQQPKPASGDEKKKGIIWKILKIIGVTIGAIISFLGGLEALHSLGWLEPIKAFICKILLNK